MSSPLLLLACAAPEPAAGAAPDTAPADPWSALAARAVLHLGFEELAADRAFDDSPSGLEALAWHEDDLPARAIPGPRGQALTFDGVEQFLYVEDTDALDLGATFTLMAWIRADPRDDDPEWPILDKYAFAGAWTGYGAWLDGGQPYAGVYAGVATATECGGARRGVFDDGAWHLYAARFDGVTVTVSVDAEVAARCDWTLAPSRNRDPLEIGTRGGSFFFKGALDELTVVPDALADDEIAALISAPAG